MKAARHHAYALCSRVVIPAKAGIQRLWFCMQRKEKQPAVYILASSRNGTLYTGVTSNLTKRIWEHRNNLVEGFSHKHGVHALVDYELHASMEAAILREKRIKKWSRAWKLELIEDGNPYCNDLYEHIVGDGS